MRGTTLKWPGTAADGVASPADPMNPLDPQHTRRVLLPSGKTIEVVYFEGAPESESTATPDQETTGLHVCPACTSRTVYPITWEEAGDEHWQMSLRCPNCEWHITGTFEQDLVERLEEVLDDGTDALVRDLRRLTQANMEEEVERFTRLLETDLIFPMDF
jgi:hypothetical protein